MVGNISPECFEASQNYVTGLMNATNEFASTGIVPGELAMLDSNGKIPMSGFLSSIVTLPPMDLCPAIEPVIPNCAYVIPESLRFVSLAIPVGYSWNPGSMDECLAANGVETTYCTLNLKGPDIGVASSPLRRNFVPHLESIFQLHKDILVLKNIKEKEAKKVLQVLDSAAIKEFAALLSNYVPGQHDAASDIQKQIIMFAVAVYSSVVMPKIGMCFPKACTVEDINESYRNLTEDSFHGIMVPGLGELPITGNLTIFASDCFTEDNKTGLPDETPGIFIFFWTLFSIIGFFIVIGTIYDLYCHNIMENTEKSNSFLSKFVLCFSAYANLKMVMSTQQSGKDHLDCMNGIRFISMTWVVLGHAMLMILNGAVRNLDDMIGLLSGSAGIAFEAIGNGLPSVDSFFLMSGILTTYIFLKELDRAGNDPKKHAITFIMYYIHRYLRITMTYALIMGVVIAVIPYLSYGPGWGVQVDESEMCRKFWWEHLLYVQTLIKHDELDQDSFSNCMVVTWYLVDDMMFHFFSPLVIYPLYFAYKMTRKHTLGMVWWLFALGCFTFGNFYISFTTQSPPFEGDQLQGLDTDYPYHVSFYFAPWVRYQAYLIGIIVGYCLHHTRGKTFQINGVLNIILWQVAFLAAFAVVYGLYDTKVTNYITLFEATFYNTFQRIAWNGSVGWVIFSCVKGHGGMVNDFLSWSFFTPLSKLTFTTYLIHIQIQNIFISSILSSYPNDFSFPTIVGLYLAHQLVSLAAGFILVLCFEFPSMKVEKLVVGLILQPFMPKKDKPDKNKIANGQPIKDDKTNGEILTKA